MKQKILPTLIKGDNFLLVKAKNCLMMTFALVLFLFVNLQSLYAQNDLNLKVMMGYQGWFNAAGDQSAPNEWRHWFQSQTVPSADNLNVDLWPEMTEYSQQYSTNMTYSNGTNAKLFSSHDASTTNTHFKWMKDYNVYGVYLQRFLGEISDPRFFQMRNDVTQNVINASATYDRHFSIMYDLSGVPDDGNLYNKLVTDWEYLINTYNLTNKPGYVKQNGLPVIAIWGIGFNKRGLNPATFEALVNYFHNTAAPQYRAYIVGGVPGQWRTLDGDSETDPRWRNIYHSLDMVSPWAVGRYVDNNGADNWKNDRIVPDLADCNSVGKDYMPVIFPGFSWYNMHDGSVDNPLNQIPRRGGDFFWHQAYNAINAGSKFVYVAMFDEVDEGTAMFKVAPNKASTPTGTSFVTLDIDGQTLPSDWYLRLANETQKMLDKTIPLSSTITISPTNIAVTGVSLSPTSASIAVGATQLLTATVAPTNATNKNVGWSSSNTSVATVNSFGLVTAIANGTATITVTTQDGAKTATSAITVTTNTTVGSPVNPIIRNIYTADPSAHVWADGRLYVYPSHDIDPPRGCDLMDQYHVYSTADMVNWVDHGEILRASQVSWGRPEGGFMWAPDCAYKNGTYYFYFPHPSGAGDTWNSTWKIGVATSSSPASGFTVQGYIPGLESMIDPCVFTDDDGQSYFYYGGGGICKGGKLDATMMAISGSMQSMSGLTDFHEATWVHKKNGIYYLSYSDNNSTNGNRMQYATSTSPLGPWTSRGVYIDPTGSATDHGSILEYKGQSYAFYHNSVLSGNDWLRSVCVDKLNYNADGTIQKVIQTRGHGTPYGGTARAIPGIIQLEDYDVGGQATSYVDADAVNSGGQYRPNEGVDIESCSEGGYDVGFTASGEWMEYTVNVASAGTYNVSLRVASGNTGGTVQLRNTAGVTLGTFTVAGTGGWQTWATVNATVTLPAGTQILQLLLTGGYNLNWIQFVKVSAAPVISSAAAASGTAGQAFSYQITASDSPTSYGAMGLPSGISVNTSTGLISGTPTTAGTYNATVTATNASGTGSKAVTITIGNPVTNTPYLGTAWPIPGTIQAENYDDGGEGVAYHDNDAINSGGQQRTNQGVDVETTGDATGTYNVGWTGAGEWLKYTVNVAATATYSLQLRVASPNSAKSLHVEIDGTTIATIAIPNTTGWQIYQTTASVTTPTITVGQHVLRIYMDTDGFNLNYISFAATTAPIPVISSAAAASGTTGTAFTYNITASNSPTSYGATGLPAGISVNTSTGVISGTPTTAGTFNATVTATNSGGTGSKVVTITIAQPAPVISSAATASGTTGAVFTYSITASNNPTSYGATGLPAGVSVNTSTGTISGTPSTAGTYTATVSATNSTGTGTKTVTITISNPAGSTPYGGTAWAIPGTIQAENYDDGGEGIAYHDNDAINSGGQQRTNQGVDVETTGDATGTYNVGWTGAGEWLKYTVNVASTGTYTLQVRVASPNTAKSFHVEIDGSTIAAIAVPNTTGWQTYQTVTLTTTNIAAGEHMLRIYMDTDGFNLNYINFASTTASSPVISSAATASGTTGSAFTYNITASNNPTSYGATGLPAGISVNTSTGSISGTPTAAGTFNATVTATNSAGTGSKAVTITVTVSSVTMYRIKNRWQNTYLYDAGDRVRYSATSSGTIYQWILEDVAGVKELKNVSTGEYMHIENLTGYVQCTARTAGWSSSRWTIEDVSTGIVRFKNVWKPDQYIHIENLQNQAQYGTIDPSWWSAEWILETVPAGRLSDEQSLSNSVILSPNPVVSGLIHVQSIDMDGEVNVSISNDLGINLYSGIEQVENATLNMNVHQLRAGTYILQLQQGDKLIHKKFIVQ